MERINKAKKLLDDPQLNIELIRSLPFVQNDIELATIINCLHDPSYKKELMLNQRKDAFYDHKDESLYLQEYAEDNEWLRVFCKKNVRNIYALYATKKNIDLAKELLEEIQPNYTAKDFLYLLYCEVILPEEIKAQYLLGLESTGKLFTSNDSIIDEELVTFNNVNFDKKELLAFFKINNNKCIDGALAFSTIKKELYKKMSDLYTTTMDLEDSAIPPEKISQWIETFCPEHYYIDFSYIYKPRELIKYKIINSLSNTIEQKFHYHLKVTEDQKAKMKSLKFQTGFLLLQIFTGSSFYGQIMQAVENGMILSQAKDIIGNIDYANDIRETLKNSAELMADKAMIYSKVQILYEEYLNSSFSSQTFKDFFIKYFQTLISQVFKEWHIEVNNLNLDQAYEYFMNNIIKKYSENEDFMIEQSSSYKDKDLYFIEALLNANSLAKNCDSILT